MSSMTTLSLLLNARFNREVAEDASFYWTKVAKYLEALIDRNDIISAEKVDILSACAKDRIKSAYSWQFISGRYKDVFYTKQYQRVGK